MDLDNMAVIFDMDGVLVDNMKYHVMAWLSFCQNHGISLTLEEYFKELNGKNAKDSFQYLFKRKVSATELEEFTDEKESLYRKLYKSHIKPAEGLIDFLKDLKENHVKLAVGTSAPQQNIDFTLNNTTIGKFFDSIIYADMVANGKPAPDIYLKASEILNVPPKRCIVFEDALLGIDAGKNAGMKVIGVTTSHSSEDLSHTDMQVHDFKGLTFEKIKHLFA